MQVGDIERILRDLVPPIAREVASETAKSVATEVSKAIAGAISKEISKGVTEALTNEFAKIGFETSSAEGIARQHRRNLWVDDMIARSDSNQRTARETVIRYLIPLGGAALISMASIYFTRQEVGPGYQALPPYKEERQADRR